MSHRSVFVYSPDRTYSISSERDAYLDTSVILQKLGSIARTSIAPFAYTSALAFIEIVGRVREASDEQFQRRKASANALFDAGVQVDWRLPDVQILNSFPMFQRDSDIYETRSASLKEIVSALRQSESRADFIHRASNSQVKVKLEYFETYKKDFGADFLAAGLAERKRSVAAFGRTEFTAQVLGLRSDYTHQELARALQASPLNYMMSLEKGAEDLMALKGIPFSKEKRREIALSNDGSIGYFLKALGWRCMDHALGSRIPDRNDALDLAHLLYLVPDARLATGDVGLAECATAIGVSVVDATEWMGA